MTRHSPASSNLMIMIALSLSLACCLTANVLESPVAIATAATAATAVTAADPEFILPAQADGNWFALFHRLNSLGLDGKPTVAQADWLIAVDPFNQAKRDEKGQGRRSLAARSLLACLNSRPPCQLNGRAGGVKKWVLAIGEMSVELELLD